MMNETAIYVFFYLIACAAMIGNVVVIYCFIRYIGRMESIMTKLLFLLHISTLLQCIASLPVYTESNGWCATMGAFHYYFGLIIFEVDVCLSVLVANFVKYNNPKIETFLGKYAIITITTTSMITFLPFITNSYGIKNKVWCSLAYHHEEDNLWAFSIFYLWSFLAWLVSMILIIHLHLTIENFELKNEIFNSILGYVLATLGSIGPRLFPRIINLFIDFTISYDAQFFIQAGIFCSSCLYCFCFYNNFSNITRYEKKARIESLSLQPLAFDTILDFFTRGSVGSRSSSIVSKSLNSADFFSSKGGNEGKESTDSSNITVTSYKSALDRPSLLITDNPLQSVEKSGGESRASIQTFNIEP